MKELTPRPRPPGWAYFIAIPFVLDIVFLLYSSFMAHGPAGASFDFRRGTQVVREVFPGLPMEKAGVRPGDIIVAVNGQPITDSQDWKALNAQFQPETSIFLTVERDGRRSQITMMIPRTHVWQHYARSRLLLAIITDGVGMICLALGLLVLFSGPHHFVAVLGALALFWMGDLIAGAPQYERAALFRQLPWILQALIFSASAVGPYVLFLFFGLFPRPVFRRGWVLPLLTLPGAVARSVGLVLQYHEFFIPEHVTGVLPYGLLVLIRVIGLAYLPAAFIMFAVGYRVGYAVGYADETAVACTVQVVGKPSLIGKVRFARHPDTIMTAFPIGREGGHFFVSPTAVRRERSKAARPLPRL